MPIRHALLCAALLGGLALSQASAARGLLDVPDIGHGGVAPTELLGRRPPMSPAEAAREAQRRYGGGKVLSVDPAGDGYRVKLVREGDVRVVFIPDR